MKQILCFGDSNTWGYDGESGERLPFKVRWTGRLQKAYEGKDVRIIEEGLCGRTTVFEDPFRQGRRGTVLLPTLLETVYERIAAERQIGYLRASDYVQCSEADQEHLNAQGHQIFAQAVYEKTERMLWRRNGWRQVV